MRKLLATLSILFAIGLMLAAPAGAQTVGTVETDPPLVPAAGEYEITANGSGYIGGTDVLVGSCTAPGDALVFGVSTLEEISATLGSIDPLADCDLAGAQTVTVADDGTWSLTGTFTVGDNFSFTAGTLDQSQVGATWVPIGDPALLAVTGADTWALMLVAVGMLALGAGALYGSRRFALA